jgi:hypothetical protein
MPDGSTPGPSGWNRIHLIVDDLDTEVSRLRPVPQRQRGAGKHILLQEPSGKVVELFQPGEPVANPPQKRRR